jgi:sugar/nucleoside kinase (ribokinase family)
MTRDFDLLVAGEINADLILSGDVIPAFGQAEKLIDDATLAIGSSSCIVACGAARLGLRVAFAGKVGDDHFGRFMLDSLAGRGIDTSHVIIDPSLKTGLTVILSLGVDRAMLTYPGSIAALRYDEIDPALLERARHLHISSYFLLDALRPDIPRLFASAHQRGLTTSLDTNFDPSMRWDGGLADVLRHTDLFFPNETELRGIAHTDVIEDGLRALAASGAAVAVKQGERGATAIRDGQIVQAPALALPVVDTTGAGDNFNAGFLYGFLNEWDLPRALRLGCVCGSLSARAAGGTTAQPTLAEALAFIAEA